MTDTPDEARDAAISIVRSEIVKGWDFPLSTTPESQSGAAVDALIAAGWTPPGAAPDVTEAMVERAAKAMWEYADDEIGWEATLGLAAIGVTYVVGQVEWCRENARAGLTAALSAQQGDAETP